MKELLTTLLALQELQAQNIGKLDMQIRADQDGSDIVVKITHRETINATEMHNVRTWYIGTDSFRAIEQITSYINSL